MLNAKNTVNSEANKARGSNPTPSGKTSPKKIGIQNAGKKNHPNSSVKGVEDENKKKSMIEWVHRFGTSEEELKNPNVTATHSCQEIPSQTVEDPKKNVANSEITSGNSLWSDGMDNMENKNYENNS